MRSSAVALVGGAGLGPWVWERVAPVLSEAGLDVILPRLRGTEGDPVPTAGVSLEDWVDDVVLAAGDVTDLTLVAHSFAGYVAAGVAARLTDRLDRVVWLDALVPRAGRSWFDRVGPETEAFIRSIAVGDSLPWFSDEQLDAAYPDHGLTSEDLRWMRANVVAQPLRTCAEVPIDRPLEALAPTVQHHYVRCRRTQPPVAPDVEHAPGWTSSSMDVSHWPMVTEPALTADRIIEAIPRRIGSGVLLS